MDISKISHADRSEVLVQALPYIQRYNGKTVVIKYGGNAMINEDLQDAVMTDIVLLRSVGVNVVLVHGGGPEINDMLKRVGKESRFAGGLRYTDEETVEIVQMVLAGKVNKHLVQLLTRNGGQAIGLCGLDGDMIQAKKHDVGEDIGFVGDIVKINTGIINDVIDNGYIPVISTIGSGENGEVYNINADTAAARIASCLHAEKLLLMTDICGLLHDKDDENTLIQEVKVSEIPSLKAQGIISGGMIPKIDCCVEAVRRGVTRTNIIDGRIPHSILIELFSDAGIGTMFSA